MAQSIEMKHYSDYDLERRIWAGVVALRIDGKVVRVVEKFERENVSQIQGSRLVSVFNRRGEVHSWNLHIPYSPIEDEIDRILGLSDGDLLEEDAEEVRGRIGVAEEKLRERKSELRYMERRIAQARNNV